MLQMAQHIAFAALAAIVCANTTTLSEKRDYGDHHHFLTETQVLSDPAAPLGAVSATTFINRDVSLWFNGSGDHKWYGNIDNSGKIFICQRSQHDQDLSNLTQTVRWVGTDAANGNFYNRPGAMVLFNDLGSFVGGMSTWDIHAMNNEGVIQWCGRGRYGHLLLRIYAEAEATNTGIMSFENTFHSRNGQFEWRNTRPAPYARISNDGTIRLINTVFHAFERMEGRGCWLLGDRSLLWLHESVALDAPLRESPWPHQSIYFAGTDSAVHLDISVYLGRSILSTQFINFGFSHAIRFTSKIYTYDYIPSSGHLVVRNEGLDTVNIYLGLGYDRGLFVKRFMPDWDHVYGFDAIFYDGPTPPQNIPPKCRLTMSTCDLHMGVELSTLFDWFNSSNTSSPVLTARGDPFSPHSTLSGGAANFSSPTTFSTAANPSHTSSSRTL